MAVSSQCCYGSLAVFILISIILFATSFDTLTPHQVGLRYNTIKVKVDDEKIYNNGRYFLGMGQKFISYPVNSVLVDFGTDDTSGTYGTTAWTKEGQIITLDVAFYYKLQRNKVYSIYQRYNQEYDARIRQIASEVIKMTTIKYECEEFFQERTSIGEDMYQMMRARLLQEFIDINLFSLRKVTIPSDFEAKVIEKVVKEQEYYTSLAKKETEVLRAEITVLQGEGNARVQTIQQEAISEALLTTSLAYAQGEKIVAAQEAASYDDLKQSFELSNDKLSSYRWAQATNKLEEVCDDVEFMMGFSGATLKVSA